MARIRSIKPELLEDERTARLTHLQWRLFVSCLLLADDYGNFRADPQRVHGAALWAHRVDTAKTLEELAEAGLLELYTIDGQRYAHVRGWSKHQKVDHPGKPTVPGRPEALANSSRDVRETVAPDQDQDQDRTGIGSGPVSSEPQAASEPAVMVFEVVGSPEPEWRLTAAHVEDLRVAFPGMDVRVECERARVWTLAKPQNRKTAKGMKAFLFAWVSRAQNRGGGAQAPPTAPRPATSFAVREEQERQTRQLERRFIAAGGK